MGPRTSSCAAALAATLALLASGCVGGDLDEDPGTTTDPDNTDGPDVPEPREHTMHFAGTTLYRAIGYDAPFTMDIGDPNHMCIRMPVGLQAFRAELAWDEPANMGIDLIGETQRYTTFGDLTDVQIDGRAVLELERNPPTGEWFLYAGHAAPGGPVNWTLNLEWIVEGADAPDVMPGSDCG